MFRIMYRQCKCGQKGFTLIELLVVIAILGALAGVAIPNVAKFIGSGKDEAKNTEIANIEAAVVAYMSDYEFGYATENGEEGGEPISIEYLIEHNFLFNTPVYNYDIDKYGKVTQSTE